MKSRHVFACFASLGLALIALPAASVDISGGEEADRAEMARISEEWLDAYASGDLDAIMAIMHKDAVVMPHNQPTSRGTEEVSAYFASRIGRPGVKFIDNLQEIRINGDWAYVLGTFQLEVASSDPEKLPYTHNGRYLVLYEKVDGNWMMLRDMDNAAPVGH